MSEKRGLPKRTIRIGRKYSEWRTSSWECEFDSSGVPIKKRDGYVRGWYGLCDEYRLQNEIMPKLAEWADQGRSYPFLITQHRLESKARVDIVSPMEHDKAILNEVKFHKRKRQTEQIHFALVFSPTEFKLLLPR